MTTLAKRDNIINQLQAQIDAHKTFLGGGVKLTDEEKDKLRKLESYLKKYGRGGDKKDLETIASLISLH